MSYKITIKPSASKEELVIEVGYLQSALDIISTIQAKCIVVLEVYKDDKWQLYKEYQLNQDTKTPYLIIYGEYSKMDKNELLATHHTIEHHGSEQEAITKFNQDNNTYGFHVIAIRQLVDANDALKMNGGE